MGCSKNAELLKGKIEKMRDLQDGSCDSHRELYMLDSFAYAGHNQTIPEAGLFVCNTCYMFMKKLHDRHKGAGIGHDADRIAVGGLEFVLGRAAGHIAPHRRAPRRRKARAVGRVMATVQGARRVDHPRPPGAAGFLQPTTPGRAAPQAASRRPSPPSGK